MRLVAVACRPNQPGALIGAAQQEASTNQDWRGRKGEEVDIVADVQGRVVPFEVKCNDLHTGVGDMQGLVAFCASKQVERAYVVTREMDDFNILSLEDTPARTRIAKIPAPLACSWLGQSGLQATRGEAEEA